MSEINGFSTREEAVREGLHQALIAAGCAFEALRPENHGQTSDAELAALISMADHVVHEMLSVVGSGSQLAAATPKSNPRGQ